MLIAATLLRIALASYLHRHPGLLWAEAGKQTWRLSNAATAAPLIVYVGAMFVAGRLPWLSLLLYFSIPLLYFGLITLLRADPRTRVAAEDMS